MEPILNTARESPSAERARPAGGRGKVQNVDWRIYFSVVIMGRKSINAERDKVRAVSYKGTICVCFNLFRARTKACQR